MSKQDPKTPADLRKPRFRRLHKAMPNPDDWKWRLVLYLTKGKIEGVPLLPHRPIYAQEVLVIKLGWEGALNTVEVKMPEINELVPVDVSLLAPSTFIALDVVDPNTQAKEQLVGEFVRRADGPMGSVYLFFKDVNDDVIKGVPLSVVVQAYWAPVGYRASNG